MPDPEARDQQQADDADDVDAIRAIEKRREVVDGAGENAPDEPHGERIRERGPATRHPSVAQAQRGEGRSAASMRRIDDQLARRSIDQALFFVPAHGARSAGSRASSLRRTSGPRLRQDRGTSTGTKHGQA
jgi:hypothetical protein